MLRIYVLIFNEVREYNKVYIITLTKTFGLLNIKKVIDILTKRYNGNIG